MARVFILISFLFGLQGHAGTFNLFQENGKVGLKNQLGEVLIPATFEALGWANGSFSVEANVTGFRQNGQWGLININKAIIAQAQYESLTYGGGNSVVAQKRISAIAIKTGIISLSGKMVIPFDYDQIQVHGLRAVVIEKKGGTFLYGLVDLAHQKILPTIYRNIYPLGSLRFAAENNMGKTALFTESGKPITGFNIDSLSGFKGGLAKLYASGLVGIINREGEILVQPKYQDIRIEADGALSGLQPSTWQVVDTNNTVLQSVQADWLRPFEGGLYKLTYKNRYGLVNQNLDSFWPVEYEALESPIQQLIAFKKSGKWGLAHITKTTQIPAEFDSLYWDGALAWIQISDKWSLAKPEQFNKPIGQYNTVSKIGSGYLVSKNGYFGVVNAEGKEIVHCVYDSILESRENLFAVKFKGLFGIITQEEFWVVAPQPNRIWLGMAEVHIEKTNDTYWLKNRNGSIVYFSRQPLRLNNGLFEEIRTDGSIKYLSHVGLEVMPTSAAVLVRGITPASPTPAPLSVFEGNGKFGFRNEKGQMVIPNRYDSARQFSEGLAPFKLVGKWGYLNQEDKIVIHPAFQVAGDFNNGHAVVRTNKWGLINASGQMVIEPRFDAIRQLSSHYEIVQNDKSGLVNNAGKVIFPPQYDAIKILTNGMILVESQGNVGVLSPEGLNVIPMHFAAIEYDLAQNRFLVHKPSVWQTILPENPKQ